MLDNPSNHVCHRHETSLNIEYSKDRKKTFNNGITHLKKVDEAQNN
jgi:hypothetical protein